MINRASQLMLVVSVGLLVAACPGRAIATSIAFVRPWEDPFARADFVGLVECKVAGEIVASFDVLETWKGTQTENETITMRHELYSNSPHCPVFLAGKKYLALGYKTYSTSRSGSNVRVGRLPDSGGTEGHSLDSDTIPLWWRDIPVDYPWFSIIGRGPLNTSEGLDESYWPFQDLQTLKMNVATIAELSPEALEELVLRGFCRENISRDRGIEIKYYLPWNSWRKTTEATIVKSKSIEEIVNALIAAVEIDTRSWRDVESVLRFGGGRLTLGALEEFDSERLQRVTSLLRSRLYPDSATGDSAGSPEDDPPTNREMRRMRAILKKDNKLWTFTNDNWDFQLDILDAIESLTHHDPEPVANYLTSWTNPRPAGYGFGTGYVLGSFFGHNCGSERKKHLLTLTRAKDETLRVAGAVYLSLEDKVLGMSHLEKLMALEGDPGVWAALTLSRRGHKESMPRALQVFDSPGICEQPTNHNRLQNRLIVLLSNSCKASGIPMPTLAFGERQGRDWPPAGLSFDGPLSQREARRQNLEWWTENKAKITLFDPWLEILKEQKID